MSTCTPLPTYLELRSFLLAHEARLQLNPTPQLDSSSETQALVTTRNRGGSSTQKGGRNQPVHNNRTSSYGYPNSSSRGNTINRGRAYFSRGNQYNRTSWQLPLVPSSFPYILGEGQVQCQLCDGYNPYLYFFNGVRIHSGTTLRQFIDRSNAMFSSGASTSELRNFP